MKKPDPAAIADTPQYGSFTTRLLAATLDLGLVLMVALPLVEWLTGMVFPPLQQEALAAVFGMPDARIDNPDFVNALLKLIREKHLVERTVMINGLQVVFVGLYTLPFWFRYSATPGKLLFRLRIQDEKTGAPLSRRQAWLRFFGYIVSTIPLSFGFMFIGLNKKRRGFHDIIAGTIVVALPWKKDKDREAEAGSA